MGPLQWRHNVCKLSKSIVSPLARATSWLTSKSQTVITGTSFPTLPPNAFGGASWANWCTVESYPSLFKIDHITPLNEGGTNVWPDNFQLLCPACHTVKTKLERSHDNDIKMSLRWGKRFFLWIYTSLEEPFFSF